jgi:3-oxoacyl-[acyl-carrier-protein] synthase II
MSERVPVITGTGVICSVGCSSESVWLSLVRGAAKFQPLKLFHSARFGQVPVAEVTADVNALCGSGVRGSRSDKLAYIAVRQALVAAGLGETGGYGNRMGIVLGATVGGVLGTEELVGDLLSRRTHRYGRLRYHECASATDLCAKKFHCFGPTTTLSTACSGGAMAIALAGQLIESGAADIVIAGGCDSLCRLTVSGFGSLLLLDPDGCRPFDVNRAGITLGEGAAALVVESAESAARRGAPVLARLTGWGCTCDAFHATAPDSEGAGAYGAMAGALRRAGLDPSSIDHVNAHGTGTAGNDLAESKAIRRLFSASTPPVLSTKGLFGHTLGASGAIDAVLCVKSIEHGGPPMSVRFGAADPEIGFAPVREALSKPQSHVMNNAFGFGGNNVSLIFSRAAKTASEQVGRGPTPSLAGPHRFSVAGVGIVSPLGSVLPDVFAACSLAGADSSVREFASPLPPGRVRVHSCPDEFGAKEEIATARRRRLERIQMMALVAAMRSCRGLASGDAGRERICVAMGTGLGSASATAAFVEPVVADENAVPSPQKFTNAVHNALASQIAIALAARGLNSTVTHREISFESALWHGTQELASGSSDYAVVGGADELTPYLLSAGVRWGWWTENSPPLRPLSANLTRRQRAIPGEGAVVFCLTQTGSALHALAEVCCVSFGRFAVDKRTKMDADREAGWIEGELADHGVSLANLDMVLSGANGQSSTDGMYAAVVSALQRRSGKTIRHGCYKHLCGEYHTASAFGMAMAVGLVSQQVAAESLLSPGGDCRTVLLYTLSGEGTRAITCVCRPGAT